LNNTVITFVISYVKQNLFTGGTRTMYYLITHWINESVECPDGRASRFIAEKYCKENNIPYALIKGLHETPYLSPFFYPSQGDKIFLLDYHQKMINNDLIQMGKVADVIVLDHHASTLNLSLENQINKVDTSKCGATLTWEYFYPDHPLPDLLKYIQRRDMEQDLWSLPWINFRNDNANIIHKAMGHLGRTDDLYDKLISLDEQEIINELKPVGYQLWDKLEEQIIGICNRFSPSKPSFLKGFDFTFKVIFLKEGEDNLTSEINKFQLSQSYVDCVLAVNSTKTSVRINSRSDFNALAIAEKCDGGGHPQSCGFPYSMIVNSAIVNR
jgi:oligoribonuclease NrnB/cAMP/cGMP phosphodiesterase (DHH superfamily)